MEIKELLQAACSGSLDVVHQSFHEDVAIFQKLQMQGATADTPLHLSSMLGHLDFVKLYIELGSITVPQLSQLNPDGYGAFHLAATNGHVHIIKHMLEFAEKRSSVKELCSKKEKNGRTALHCAVASGQIEVIDVLIDGYPEAASEVSGNRDSVMHIAVKHHQFEALKLLVQKLGQDLLSLGDREGNTVLHLATAQARLQAVEYLVNKQPGLDVNAENSCGLTPMDTIFACCATINSNNIVYIEEAIRKAGGHRSQVEMNEKEDGDDDGKSIHRIVSEMNFGILVMASIVATLTFQVGLTPPGGFWQDSHSSHQAGHSILYDLSRKEVIAVMAVNFQAFFSAVATIIASLQSFENNAAIGVLLSNFVQYTLAFTVADFLMVMAITTGRSGLFRKP